MDFAQLENFRQGLYKKNGNISSMNEHVIGTLIPKISIIIPTYNRVDRIKVALTTYLETQIQNAEFIILDNNSSDGTWEYLEEVALKDKRLRILKNTQNIGALKSIFRLYCEVRAPYVLFLADDDIMIGDYISKCLEIFENNSDVGVVHHFFNGWAHKIATVDYSIIAKGDNATIAGFMMFGSYPGIAWRMKDLDLEKFPLNQGLLYPQVKVSLDIISKKNFAIIHDCGLLALDFGDSIYDVIKSQGRPLDYGIKERMSYIENKYKPFTVQEIAWNFGKWAYKIYEDLQLNSKNDSRNFIKALLPCLNKVSPILIIRLIYNGKFFDAIYCIFGLIKYPSFIKYYYHFYKFSKMKKNNKYKKL